jgi:hypothetical protein
MTTIDITSNIIRVDDIIDRIEEIESARQEYDDYHNSPGAWAAIDDGEVQELETLYSIMEDIKGAGGDEQWRGDWYPLTLIRESHFRDYAEELAVDCGMVNEQASWPNNCIDWELAARELKYDYTSTDIDGCTYYFR